MCRHVECRAAKLGCSVGQVLRDVKQQQGPFLCSEFCNLQHHLLAAQVPHLMAPTSLS